MSGTLEVPEIGEFNKTADPKIVAAVKKLKDLLNGENLIPRESLASAARPVQWYTPKIIGTEENRSAESFSTLTTADEIPNITTTEGGLLFVLYRAKVKSSSNNGGRVRIYLNETPVKNFIGQTQELTTEATTSFRLLYTHWEELKWVNSELADSAWQPQGIMALSVEPGTFALSVKYRGVGGATVTAKERKLWAVRLGS